MTPLSRNSLMTLPSTLTTRKRQTNTNPTQEQWVKRKVNKSSRKLQTNTPSYGARPKLRSLARWERRHPLRRIVRHPYLSAGFEFSPLGSACVSYPSILHMFIQFPSQTLLVSYQLERKSAWPHTHLAIGHSANSILTLPVKPLACLLYGLSYS